MDCAQARWRTVRAALSARAGDNVGLIVGLDARRSEISNEINQLYG
jgi:hypothetical protein